MKIALVIALVAATIGIGALAPADVRNFLAREGGPIEWATVACYALALGYILVRGLYQKTKWIFWLVVLFIMRELDFDARFTSGKITKFDFYLAPDLSLLQALYAFAVLGGFVFVLFMTIKSYGKSFANEVKERTPIALAVTIALVAVGLSKLIDGPRRKAKYFGLDPSDDAIAFFQIIEESIELLIPLMIIVALTHYYQRIFQSRSGFSAER